MRMVLVWLMTVACAPDVSTPEAFAEVFPDAACAAGAECGVYDSFDVCMEAIADSWYEGCKDDSVHLWQAEAAEDCMANVEVFMCGSADEREASPCWWICRD